ncbi:MAG: hypothetical protein QF858_02075 [Candidatus Pacebacteria bacterium]|jgi:hypothetical protein|nr:hypothetical protein [bacterium]MDP6527643.1 hypothetical protein [Candidatus Paceibacterota bacterium]MDP6659441.1 hypothetical protein [Candidatus Paceibacterota bacterium]|tara:strand:- start:1348 stop:1605 length:258 start_codon:yes stop_codon:yes gene_type:complete
MNSAGVSTTAIVVLIIIIAALGGWYFLYGPGSGGGDTVEEAGFGGALFDSVQAPVDEATDTIPETNPLEQVEANPLKNYKNPFSN